MFHNQSSEISGCLNDTYVSGYNTQNMRDCFKYKFIKTGFQIIILLALNAMIYSLRSQKGKLYYYCIYMLIYQYYL